VKIYPIGTPLREYPQYRDLADDALAAFGSPLTNGLPSAKDARELIGGKRLFFVRNRDHLLVFSAHIGCYRLYYAAQEDAVLQIPPTRMPIVAELARQDAQGCPQCDALMARSAFTLERVDVRMERALDDTLCQEQYLPDGMPRCSAPDYAMTGEYYKINTLLHSVFDPLLDALPGRDELMQRILDGLVYVIRDQEKIAAAVVYSLKGGAANPRWIAVDFPYRAQNLGGLLHWHGDRELRKKGFRKATLWANEKSMGWLHTLEDRGYLRTSQRLYTHILRPR
jgi:hypothetical protein